MARTTSTRTSIRKKTRRGYKPTAKSVTRYGKFKRRRATYSRIPRPTPLYPNGKLVKHRYVDRITVPSGGAAGLTSYYVFRANSMYDPDYTGVGHQPFYRDQMAAIYSIYTVLKAYIKVTVPNESTVKGIWGLCCDDQVAVEADPEDCMEQHKYRAVMRLDKMNRPLVLTGSFRAAAWEKCSVAAFLADDQNRTPVGSNPNKNRNFIIWQAPVAGGETAPGTQVVVEIVYETLWREPTLPMSS